MSAAELASTLPDAIQAAADHHGDQRALTDGDRSLSYAELADRMAGGAPPVAGEVVAVTVSSPLDALVDLVRLTAGGAAMAPLDPTLPAPAAEALVARLHPWAASSGATAAGRPGPDDVALVVATSGTTRRPKLVELTHRNLRASAVVAADRLGLTAADGVVALSPFSHVLALRAALDALWMGSTLVLPRPGEDDQRLDALGDALEHPAATYAVGSPAVLEAVAAVFERRAPPAGLRFVRSGAARLTPAARTRVEAALGVPVLAGYGMTEAAKIATPTFPREPGREHTVGRPALAFRVVAPNGDDVPEGEVGQIVVRGEGVVRRYHDEDDLAIDDDGWLHTGDLGRLDDGHLVLAGRLDHVINRGGEQISPATIEHHLLTHPGIAAALVTGVDHLSLGQAVGALVVPVQTEPPSPSQIIDWLRARVPRSHLPAALRLVPALPTDAKGGPDHRGAAELLRDQPTPNVDRPERSDLVEAVGAVWDELLATDGPAPSSVVDAEFFTFGGNSLLALELAVRLGDLTGAQVPPGLARRHPTITAQAHWLASHAASDERPSDLVVTMADPDAELGPVPVLVLLPGVDGTASATRAVADALHRRLPTARVLAVETPVRAVAPLETTTEIADSAIEALAAADVEPTVLVGLSFGSHIAVAIARHRASRGRPVDAIVLADLPHPSATRPSGGRRGRVRGGRRVLWSARGVLPLRHWWMLLRPLPRFPDESSIVAPHHWRALERRRMERLVDAPRVPLGDTPTLVVATLRQVRRTLDATLGWRDAVDPLAVRLVASNHQRLFGVDAHLLADAVVDFVESQAGADQRGRSAPIAVGDG